MMKNNAYKIDRSRRKSGKIVIVILILGVAILTALLIALIWQNSQNTTGSDLSSISHGAAPPASSLSTDSSSELEPVSSSDPEPPKQPELSKGALPKSERVGSAYFDDAVFVGDSVTEGMLYCIGMENARILAGNSINFSTIYTAEVIKLSDGTRNTIMNELTKQPYNKVYVMLGGNEVRDQSKESFTARYSQVLDDIKAAQPDAIFYVQSMTPVTKNNNYKMDNARIDEFNVAVMELAHQKGMYYLDVAESMKNEAGMLPDEASPTDGMHFGQPYFDKWYAYLKTHVAPGTYTPDQLVSADKPIASEASSGSGQNTDSEVAPSASSNRGD